MLNLRGKHGLGLFLVLISGELGFYSPRALDWYRFGPILRPSPTKVPMVNNVPQIRVADQRQWKARKLSESSRSDPPELLQVFWR